MVWLICATSRSVSVETYKGNPSARETHLVSSEGVAGQVHLLYLHFSIVKVHIIGLPCKQMDHHMVASSTALTCALEFLRGILTVHIYR